MTEIKARYFRYFRQSRFIPGVLKLEQSIFRTKTFHYHIEYTVAISYCYQRIYSYARKPKIRNRDLRVHVLVIRKRVLNSFFYLRKMVEGKVD